MRVGDGFVQRAGDGFHASSVGEAAGPRGAVWGNPGLWTGPCGARSWSQCDAAHLGAAGGGASLCRYEMILAFQRSSDLLISSSDPFLSVYAVWIYAKAVTTQFQIIYMSLP